MKLLSAALLGCLTTGVIAHVNDSHVHDVTESDEARRRNPPKCKGPNCPRPKGKAPPKKAPSAKKAPVKKAPVKKAPPKRQPPPKKGKSPPPKKQAPKKKAPAKKAPPCKGRNCPRPCKGPNCAGNKGASLNKIADRHVVHTTTGLPIPVPAEHPGHFIDDVFYPKPLLKKMADKGLNVSGLKAITGMYSEAHSGPAGGGRGLVEHLKWTERDPVDNKIVIPFTFHADYPPAFKTAAIAAYEKMNADLGCIKTKYIDESLVSSAGAPHANGIIIAYQDLTGNGCYSALGKAPGFKGRSPLSSITDFGAPSGWQLMSYGDMATSSCSGDDEGTLMHEMLHALGVKHEHARPDREDFLIVDMDATTMDSQFTLIDTESWIQVFDDAGNDRYPYETISVMHYCSMCGASGNAPVMTYKDGSIFGSGEFMTTTDSLQIIWNYCNADADHGNPKETINCQSLDKFNLQRPVYTDRVCDGRFDCFGGEDEIDGSMAVCIPESTLDTGCCGSYWVGGVEFVYADVDLNGHGTWHNPNNNNDIILRWSSGTWYRGTAGNPQITGEGFSYMALSEGENPTNAACPPVDTSWATLGGDQYSVLCKSSGAQFNTVNECVEQAPCDPVATCTDTVAGFTCACPSTHTGTGIGAGSCTEIVLEDECANGNNNCPEVCTDQQIGFTCSCQDGQFDANGDGMQCSEVEPCCEVFKMGLSWANYKLLCTHERTHSGTGMMDYACEADPDFSSTPTGFTMPTAVQFVQNINPAGYFLTNGVGVIPEDAGGVSISYFTLSEAPAGAICPSMNGADWAQTSGQDWALECVQFVQPDTPSDPDQCADGSHNCSQSGTCTNTDDGFTCACNEGFGGDGVTCTPLVDECAAGIDNCDANAFCTNTPDAYDCVCMDGFDGDGFSCTQVDVNECEDGTHQCNEANSVCVNTEGDYQCNCINTNTWVQVNDKTCEDLDECQDPNTCADQPNTICFNLIDEQNQDFGFTCHCLEGYEAGEVGCEDVNECSSSPSPCGGAANDADNQICTNLPGSFECSCKHDGFVMSVGGGNGQGNICMDTDECLTGDHICDDLPCVNLEGSHTCECPPGTAFEHGTASCLDVDECMGDPCMVEMANPAVCVNTDGSFECQCNDGFAHTSPNAPHECVDIDECGVDIDACSVGAGEPAECFNFEGGYECECATGFIASTDNMRSTGFHCIDVDECAFGDVCNAANGNPVSCVNIEGGFTCECNDGFTADSTGACLDHNECENDPCPATMDCVNVEGGFECQCAAGSQAAGDGCEDIDECADDIGLCDRADGNAAICTNTPGSYQCDCEQGYLVDDSGWCNDIDECNLFRMRVSCSANTDCVNTPGSFECTCKDGFEGEQRTFGTVCVDVDECAGENDCPGDTNCVNLPGTYDCECPTGTTNIAPEGEWECSQDDPCTGVECEPGFECVRENGQGFCADIDECNDEFGVNACAEVFANCVNKPGFFECQCPNTLVMNGDGICVGPCEVHECPVGEECQISEIAGIAIVNCVDIDECVNDGMCHESAVCQNTNGGFECICANDGEIGVNGPNGMECETEVDVCANVQCPENASCNAAGTCDCSDGFIMSEDNVCEQSADDDLCQSIQCEPGFACDDGTGACVDIDECADASHMCDFFEECVNDEGSYSCTFDASQCPAESPVIWKGAKFGRVFYRGDSSIELRVTITNKNIDVKTSTYYGMMMFGKKKCGGDFLRALTDGRVQVDVMDADHIYNVIDIYHRDDSGQSSTQIMFNLFNTETVDHPFSKKKGESMKKDQMYVSFWNLHTVNWGNKDWEECLELATVGAVQQIAEGDETFTNACATWQKTLWN